MKMISFLITGILFAAQAVAISQQAGLQVTVTGLQNGDGRVGVLVFRDDNGYPADPEQAVAEGFGMIRDSRSDIMLEGLEPGTYVITVMHDENENGKLDKDLLGRPKEGYGVSNDPSPRKFGPPRFEDGKFEYKPGNAAVTIKMRYD